MISLTAAILLLSTVDQDGVINTAPRQSADLPLASASTIEAATPSTTVGSAAAPHGLSTSEQISQWVGQGRAERASSDRPWDDGFETAGPRKPRSEFSVSMGTGGYRDYSAAVELPLGESGTLNLAVRQSKNDPYAYGDYYSPYDVWGRGHYREPGYYSGLRGPESRLLQGGSAWSRDRVWEQKQTADETTSVGFSLGIGRNR